jgi:hypothetical protein
MKTPGSFKKGFDPRRNLHGNGGGWPESSWMKIGYDPRRATWPKKYQFKEGYDPRRFNGYDKHYWCRGCRWIPKTSPIIMGKDGRLYCPNCRERLRTKRNGAGQK